MCFLLTLNLIGNLDPYICQLLFPVKSEFFKFLSIKVFNLLSFKNMFIWQIFLNFNLSLFSYRLNWSQLLLCIIIIIIFLVGQSVLIQLIYYHTDIIDVRLWLEILVLAHHFALVLLKLDLMLLIIVGLLVELLLLLVELLLLLLSWYLISINLLIFLIVIITFLKLDIWALNVLLNVQLLVLLVHCFIFNFTN
jgi:hypothetical protein